MRAQPPVPVLEPSELLRKLVHIGSGAFALLLEPLGFLGSLGMALAAVAHNTLILPRYAKRYLFRAGELDSGHSRAIVAYPISVLLLILAFPDRLGLAAAAWGILAAGDGMAGLAGRLWGSRHPLPWNRSKSWVGFGVFLAAGTAAGGFLLHWNGGGPATLAGCLALAGLASAVASLAESLPSRSEDNLTVPLAAGLTLALAAWPGADWSRGLLPELRDPLLLAAGVNLVFGLAARALGSVDSRGAVAGILVGTGIWLGFGLAGWSLLLSFLVLGSLATRWGYRRKEALGLAEGRGGRRGWGSALAKGLVPAAAGLLAVATGELDPFRAAAAGALAAVAFDTIASELGPLYGRRTFRLWPPGSVPPGSEGAVSLEGTLAGMAGAGFVAAVGLVSGFLEPAWLLPILGAALLANLAESLAGSTLEVRGLLSKGWINLGNSLLGALVAAWLTAAGS